MNLNDLESSINYWFNVLEKYSIEQLTLKYQDDKWSLGQVFMHLIQSSKFFLNNASACLETEVNNEEPFSVSAESIFLRNELPNIEIKGPASNDLTPQPISVAFIFEELVKLKMLASSIKGQLERNNNSGKLKHPGLGYLNAGQWYQFADIHMRHHIVHLPRIESQLATRSGHN